MTDVRVPGSAFDSDGADLVKPSAELAKALGLFSEETPSEGNEPTPQSLQVIQAGALFFSKSWANWVAGGTGVAGLASGLSGFFLPATAGLTAAGQAALIAGALAVVSAGAIAVAMIVASDVRSRAAATVAQYNARAEIARALLAAIPSAGRRSGGDSHDSTSVDLSTSRSLSLALAVAAFGDRVRATPDGGGAQPVTGMRNDLTQGLSVELAGRDWVAVRDIEKFQTADSDPKP